MGVMRQYELVERVKSYDPATDEDALNRAYVYAMKMHGSQIRESGDPYFSHPIEVAGILTKYRLDTASIITGLLHDTIEDTPASMADIKELFGDDVAHLVDGVTKPHPDSASVGPDQAGRELPQVRAGDERGHSRPFGQAR